MGYFCWKWLGLLPFWSWNAIARSRISRIAIRLAIAHEEACGRVVESVESENRGFDLISHRPHPEDPKTFEEIIFLSYIFLSLKGE